MENKNKTQTISKLNYDFENDSLFVFPKSRVPENYKISEHVDNFILDLDKNNNLIGIEILNASKVFNTTKTFLNSVTNYNFLIDINEKTIKIQANLKVKIRNNTKEKEIQIEKLNLDNIHTNFSQLAVA